MNIVLAPHLDDEIIGCYSIWGQIDHVVYFKRDYRANLVPVGGPGPTYTENCHFEFGAIHPEQDTLYIPSQFDYHPLHRRVRAIGLSLPGKKMFYSVEMNVPWLEEEEDPVGKCRFFDKMYPGEIPTIGKNDKYFLFKSIKPFDEYIWASVKFTRPLMHCWPGAPEEVGFLRNVHRHLFHFQVDVQQYGDNRDVEYFLLSKMIQKWFDEQKWAPETSCEMFARGIKWWLESQYVDPVRKVRVSVYEDGENGAVLE